jgi:hypothetical protein
MQAIAVFRTTQKPGHHVSEKLGSSSFNPPPEKCPQTVCHQFFTELWHISLTTSSTFIENCGQNNLYIIFSN